MAKNSRFTWDLDRLQFRDNTTGRFVPPAQVFRQVNRVIDVSEKRMRNLGEQLRTRAISVRQFKDAMRTEVKALHVATSIAANGGLSQMTPSRWGAVGGRLRREYTYLNKFGNQVGTRKLPRESARIRSRARAYAANARLNYWQTLNQRLEESGMEVLAARKIGPVATEHCAGCLSAANEWKPLNELPAIGSMECKWFCACSIVYKLKRGRKLTKQETDGTLDRVAASTRDQPLLSTDLTRRERDLIERLRTSGKLSTEEMDRFEAHRARGLFKRGMIQRDKVDGRFVYYVDDIAPVPVPVPAPGPVTITPEQALSRLDEIANGKSIIFTDNSGGIFAASDDAFRLEFKTKGMEQVRAARQAGAFRVGDIDLTDAPFAGQDAVDVSSIRRLIREFDPKFVLEPGEDIGIARWKGRNVVVDGHHRIASQRLLGQRTVRGEIYDLDAFAAGRVVPPVVPPPPTPPPIPAPIPKPAGVMTKRELEVFQKIASATSPVRMAELNRYDAHIARRLWKRGELQRTKVGADYFYSRGVPVPGATTNVAKAGFPDLTRAERDILKGVYRSKATNPNYERLGSYIPTWNAEQKEVVDRLIARGLLERMPDDPTHFRVLKLESEVFAPKSNVKLLFPERGFTTTREAQAWANKAHPDIVFDFKHAHIDTINPTLKELDRLLNQFPEIADRLRYVGTYRDKAAMQEASVSFGRRRAFSGEYAHASTDGRRIGLNPSWYGDPERLKTSSYRDTLTRWHPPGTDNVESIITHEFGHQIDHWLTVQESTRNELIIFKNRNRADASLSRYAMKNSAEAWAESFSALRYTPEAEWSAYTRNHAAFLDRLGLRWR